MKTIYWKLNEDHFPFKQDESYPLEIWAQKLNRSVEELESMAVIDGGKWIWFSKRGVALEQIDNNIKCGIYKKCQSQFYTISIDSDSMTKEVAEEIVNKIQLIIDEYNKE